MELYRHYLKQKILSQFKKEVQPIVEQFINEQEQEIFVKFDDDRDYIKLLISSELDNKVRKNIKKFIEREVDTANVKITKEGLDVFIDEPFSQVQFVSLLTDLKDKLKKKMKRLKRSEYILY